MTGQFRRSSEELQVLATAKTNVEKVVEDSLADPTEKAVGPSLCLELVQGELRGDLREECCSSRLLGLKTVPMGQMPHS